MKSYNGLFNRMTEIDEIKASIKEAAKKRSKKWYVKLVMADLDGFAERLRDTIVAERWEPEQHETVILREGYHKKERTITKPRWDSEQIVHHMLTRQLIPIVEPRLYRFSCGSVKGRGTHYLLKAMKSWVKGYGKNRFYVAELDIRKFYDSIYLDILKHKLNRLIRDKAYKRLLFKVIGHEKTGLPKGYYTSPWLAHVYLMDADNYITQTLKPDHYARYVDNMWLFSRNKRELHRMVNDLNRYLQETLHVELKDDWQVYRFESKDGDHGRAINLLGFIVHRRHIGIRKGILKRIRAKANRVHRKGSITIKDASSIVSRMGYFKYADAHGYYKDYIKPKVSIRYLKRKIRKNSLTKRGKTNDRLEPRTRRRKTLGAGFDVQQNHCLRTPQHCPF